MSQDDTTVIQRLAAPVVVVVLGAVRVAAAVAERHHLLSIAHMCNPCICMKIFAALQNLYEDICM